MSSIQDTPLASIQATLDRHITLTRGYLPNHLPTTTPRFDASALPSFTHRGPVIDYAKHISSLGFPTPLASDVTVAVTQESQQYQAFVEQVRLRLLAELSTSSVTPDASTIPSLVEAACNVFKNQLINSGLEAIQKIASEAPVNGLESDGQSGSDSDSGSSDGEDDDVDEDEESFDQGEEDDNAPMKPGEDVPPLETKYLPIFEALHERGKVLTKPEKTYLVNMTGMTYRQITIWFQNRRRGELKENMNLTTSYSKASSTHSDESTEFSDPELEKTLGSRPPNTTFDIRSWRLQSALATKDDSRVSIPPLSPLKFNFPSTVDASDTESDTDLSDSDDDISMPPGLQAPSLTTSVTTVDSSITSSTSASIAKGSTSQPPASMGGGFFASKEPGHPRPIRSLPASRRSSPSTTPQQMQHQYSHSLNTQDLQNQLHQSVDATPLPSQCVSSNESGLTVNLDATAQLQTSTLRSSPASVSLVPTNAFVPGPPSISPSPPSTSAGSPQRQPSPTTSASPRPHIKPLPRRTGCAPRPRPPPRSGPSGPTPAPVSAPGSSRPSVVLPPSSNPSLGNTTLGALLRPNPPAPAIPHDIEERLTAMAGRMGVGANFGSGAGARQSTSSNAPRGGTPGSNILPNRGPPFSFGPTSLPRTSVSSGTRPVPGQTTRGSANIPPP